MINGTNELRQQRIQELEREIVEYHVPRAVRPIGKTILSAMPLLFSVGAHTAWSYLSPETHPEGAATLNHILAGALFVGYNGYRMLNGEFRGLADRYREYRKAEDELTELKGKAQSKESL